MIAIWGPHNAEEEDARTSLIRPRIRRLIGGSLREGATSIFRGEGKIPKCLPEGAF